MSTRSGQVPARLARARKKSEVTVASSATLRHLRSSAQKTRLVVDQIRGRRVDEARALLRASRKAVAHDLEKLLRSALANTENKPEVMAMIDADELVVTRVEVGDGPMMKRTQPAPMGRAYPIRKRSCHVTIELGSIARPAARAAKPSSGRRPRTQEK